MPKSKNVIINYTNREFSTIKEDLVDYAKRYYPDSYKDFTKASFGSMILDTVSYVGDILSYYLDYNVNESFLDTSIEFDNIRKHARALGYNYSGPPSSYGHVTLYILVPADSEGMAPDLNYLPTIKTGTQLTSTNGVNFVLSEDVRFDADGAELVAARFDGTTGKTPHFAVMNSGMVQSGKFFEVEVDLTTSAFEKFKRLRIGENDITEIFSVYDSSGNRYYEVDNLSQETIFLETTNPDAASDGVRSIIKPLIVPRRFVVQQDDSGTYIQFGFGSEDEDSSGLADPSRVALKMHGKNNISNLSFDPTNLLSTNKLGISPYNTTLFILYRTNSFNDASVGSNSITNVSSLLMEFENESGLDSTEVSAIRNSVESSNTDPITSLSEDISIEELKARAKSHYATQGRAVTKQDYESVIYNMPTKFGAIKRANIINDPSSTNRKISLYVISQDNSGYLSKTHDVIKNNIKNWLSRFKVMNDTIEIYDAVVLNYGIDFTVMADRMHDSDSVLQECISELEEYFYEYSYIGEPLYITRIYEMLNRVEGVVDVKKVEVFNLSGGNYSSYSLDFDDISSSDGTYYKVPKNVILELKFPELDIKGTVK